MAYSSADRCSNSNPTETLVAYDPRVVAGLNDVRPASTDPELGSVLVLDGDPSGLSDADVADLALSVPATGLS